MVQNIVHKTDDGIHFLIDKTKKVKYLNNQ